MVKILQYTVYIELLILLSALSNELSQWICKALSQIKEILVLPLEPSAYHDYTSPSDSAQLLLYAVYCGTASHRRTTRGNTLGMVQGRHRHRWQTGPCLRLAWRGWRAEHPGVSPGLASCELGSQSPLIQRSRRLPGKRLTLKKKFRFILK